VTYAALVLQVVGVCVSAMILKVATKILRRTK
jgi:hypothetical protein